MRDPREIPFVHSEGFMPFVQNVAPAGVMPVDHNTIPFVAEEPQPQPPIPFVNPYPDWC